MAIINNTRSPYNGKRKGFDLSPYILSPEQLYAAHKARVLADGCYESVRMIKRNKGIGGNFRE